jgi:hypothetical protein
LPHSQSAVSLRWGSLDEKQLAFRLRSQPVFSP